MIYTKEQISEKFIKPDGTLNMTFINTNNDMVMCIKNEVPFADKIGEKIYCILNDIYEPPHCPVCKSKLKYKSFTIGYPKSCKKSICKRSVTKWESSSKTKKKNNLDDKNKFYDNLENIDSYVLPYDKVYTYVVNRELETDGGLNGKWTTGYKNLPMLYSILHYTKDLVPIDIKKLNWSNRYYIIFNKIKDIPKCVSCDNPSRYINFKIGYQKNCSHKCSNSGYAGRKRLENHIKNIVSKIDGYTVLTDFDRDYDGLNKTRLELQCNICDKIFDMDCSDGKWQRIKCPFCMKSISRPESEIYDYITSLGINCNRNDRTVISPMEVDLYIPESKIAFELNGNYWHSELWGGKDRKYHLDKTLQCSDKDVKLIHIFEDEWIYKQQIVKSRIKHILGETKYNIYGRKCTIKEIDSKTKNKFIKKYHIQDEDKANIKLGCFYKTHLVAVMTFCKLRTALGNSHKVDEWELSRYCTVSNFNCIGIASKLLRHFEKTYKPKSILTYADRRWSTGNMYYKLGFELLHISPPNYWYIHKNYIYKRYHRYNFRKNILFEKLDNFDPKLTENDNMKNNNYSRIWDCGNYVYKKKLSKN